MANYDGDITLTVDLEPGDIQSVTEDLQERIQDIVRNPGGMQVVKGFKQLQTTMVKATERADKLLKRMHELEGLQFESEAYTKVQTAIESLEAKFVELNKQRKELEESGKIDTNEYDALEYKLNKIYKQTLLLQHVRDKMELSGEQWTPGEETQEYANLAQQLNTLNNQMTISVERADSMSASMGRVPAVFSAARTLIVNLGTALARVASILSSAFINGLKTVATTLARVASSAAKASANLLKMVGHSIVNGIRSLISNLGKLASSLTKTHKSTGSANDAFKKGLKTLIKYGFGVRSFFFLWRKMRKAVGEGIGNLAQYSSPFNQVISNFISSLTLLKNAFATAFAPIIDVVAPILSTFIDLVAEAVTKIGMLIAALTGKSTFIRAKKVQEDYAASLDKSAGSANDATKAAKEYKKTIAGFDDVEILKEPDSGSGSGGSGGGGASGGGADVNDMFETVNIPDALSNWADKVKQAWREADFTELGNIIGTKIGTILNNLPWDKIQENASKFGKSFATFFNGLMESEIELDDGTKITLGEAVGTAIGETINTGITFLDSLTETIEFDSIGTFIANGMNNMTITVNWNGIATTLSNAANGVFNVAATWSGKFKFGELSTAIKNTVRDTLNGITWDNAETAAKNIGSGLADALNKFFTADLFESAAKALGSAINTALKGGYTFIGDIDWDGWATSLSAGINVFFATLNWDDLHITFNNAARALAKGIKAACEVTNTFLTGIKWDDVATTLSASINVFFATLSWDELKVTFNNAARALADGIKTACKITNTFLTGLEWDNVATTLSSSINIFFARLSWDDLKITFNNAAKALADGIKTACKITNTFLTDLEWDKIATTLSSSINIFFARLSWEEIGVTFNNIASAVAKGVKTAISTIHTLITDVSWTELGKAVGNSVNTFFKDINWKEIGVTFDDFLNGIIDGLSSVLVTIDFETVGANIATALTSVDWDKLIEKLGAAIVITTEALQAFLDGLFGGLQDAFDQWLANKFGVDISELQPAIDAREAEAQLQREYAENFKWPWEEGFKWPWEEDEPISIDVNANAVSMSTENIPAEQTNVEGEVLATRLDVPDGLNVIDGTKARLKRLDTTGLPEGDKTITGMQGKTSNLDNSNIPASDKIIPNVKAAVHDLSDEIVGQKRFLHNIFAGVHDIHDEIPSVEKQIGNFKVEFTDYNSAIPEEKLKTGISGFTVNAEHLNQSFIPDAEKLINTYAKITKTDKGATIKSKDRQLNNFKAVIETFKSAKKATGKTQSGFTGTLNNYKEALKNVKGKTQSGFTGEIVDYDEAKKVTGKNPSGFVAKVTDYDVPSKRVTGFTAVFDKVEGLESKIKEIYAKFGIKTAMGGAYYGGAWHDIAQYATGGVPTHGTVFVAGEAGAEAVGHINGRTEVLNQSQMAAVMYSAVVNGTASLVKVITSHMTTCTNATIANIGNMISYLNFISGKVSKLDNIENIIANATRTGLTDIVIGKVVPVFSGINDIPKINNALNKIVSMLQYSQDNQLTEDAFAETMTTIFRQYMNISFYLGDEQLAKHANAGNRQLEMRFNPVAR